MKNLKVAIIICFILVVLIIVAVVEMQNFLQPKEEKTNIIPSVEQNEIKEKQEIKPTSFEDNKQIQTVPTLLDEVQDNTVWCGTFQLIWNDLKDELAKQDIVMQPQLKVVENLNKETFQTKDLSETSYYKKIGNPTYALKEEIEKAILDKFNEKSDILDDFTWSNQNTEDYFLYAMLKKEFQFEKEFDELEKGKFGNYDQVQYFGIKEDSDSSLRSQVRVLYYQSKDDFAIKLLTKQNDEVILCKNPQGKTFSEIYENIQKQQKQYQGSSRIQEEEIVKIPNIKLKEKTSFDQICKRPFLFANRTTLYD